MVGPWTRGSVIATNLLGVPYAQRRQVQAQCHRGVAGFIREAVDCGGIVS